MLDTELSIFTLFFIQRWNGPMIHMYHQFHSPKEELRLRKLNFVALNQPTETMFFSIIFLILRKIFPSNISWPECRMAKAWSMGLCTLSLPSSCPGGTQCGQDHLNRRWQYMAPRLLTMPGISKKEPASYLQALFLVYLTGISIPLGPLWRREGKVAEINYLLG